jgi:hypothetical protein
MNSAMKMISLAKVVEIDSEKKRARRKYQPWVFGLIVAFAASFAVPLRARAETAPPTQFASAKDALHALVAAAKAKDRGELGKIFGSDYDRLLSGDQVEDDKDLKDFAEAVQESAKLRKDSDAKYTVIVGKDNWPTPIPLVLKDSKWEFDAAAGLEEVLNRRIGENELAAIQTCRAYAVAQWEYFTESDWDHDGVSEYAQHLISSSGKHDGLFWETAEDEKPSPLGSLIAAARTEGYGPRDKEQTPGSAGKGGSAKEIATTEDRAPYYGYYVKILTRQGLHAPGGKYSYIINGNMIAGYALVVYPEKWGNTGVMTFIVNQQGRVYQKNLGANTAKIAATMAEYDPDPTWKLVEQP